MLQTLQKASIWDYEVMFEERTVLMHCLKFLPQYVSILIVMIKPNVCLTVVCYNYIGLVHYPDFLFNNLIMSSFANPIHEQCQDCGHCQYQLCILWWLLLWLDSNLADYQLVSINCTVVLECDASEKQQNNVK